MKQKLSPERLDELANLYLQRYAVPTFDYSQQPFQKLGCAILDAQVMINPLSFGWFQRQKENSEIIGATSTEGNEFVVKDVTELAQFLSALSGEVNEERQRRLGEFIPEE